MFGAFSVLLWLAIMVKIPWLRDAFGISPIIGWYVSATAFVLIPTLIFGCLMAWRELPERELGSLRKRLRTVEPNQHAGSRKSTPRSDPVGLGSILMRY